MGTLDTLITNAISDKALLASLLGELQTTTLMSDEPNLYAAPTYNEQTDVWTLAQDVANTSNNEYEGVYRLPVPDACSQIEIVSVVSHQNPASAAPARLLTCATESDPTPSYEDQLSVSALDGQCFNAFTIRSASAYEIQVRLIPCPDVWCYTFDFTDNDAHGWTLTRGSTSNNGIEGQYGIYSRHDGVSGTAYSSTAVIEYDFDDPVNLTRVLVEWYNNWDVASDNAVGSLIQFGSYTDSTMNEAEGPINNSYEFDQTDDHLLVRVSYGYSGGYPSPVPVTQIKRVTLNGTGMNPFGAGNCEAE